MPETDTTNQNAGIIRLLYRVCAGLIFTLGILWSRLSDKEDEIRHLNLTKDENKAKIEEILTGINQNNSDLIHVTERLLRQTTADSNTAIYFAADTVGKSKPQGRH